MTRKKEHLVFLSSEKRDELKELISKGVAKAKELTRARILLKADQGEHGPGWIDKQIAEAFEIGIQTVQRTRKKFAEQGIETAIKRKEHEFKEINTLLDGEQEAKLIAMIQGNPPKGYLRWSIRLITTKLIEYEIVETISRETVRRTLKKLNLNLG